MSNGRPAVVFVHPTVPPLYTGGIETMLSQWIDHFATRGYPVYALHQDRTWTAHRRWEFLGATMIATPTASVERALDYRSRFGEDDATGRLRDEFHRILQDITDEVGRVGVVHANNIHAVAVRPMAEGLAAAANDLGIPAVHLANNVWPVLPGEDPRYVPAGYRHHSGSRGILDAYAARGAWPADGIVTRPGVDPDLFTPDGPADPRISRLPGFKVFLPGRASRVKGAEYLIAAAGLIKLWTARAAEEGTGFLAEQFPALPGLGVSAERFRAVTAAGFGVVLCDSLDPDPDARRDYRLPLRQLATEHGVQDQVTLVALPYDDMPAAHRAADLVVTPSQRPTVAGTRAEQTLEGLCQAVIEGMSSERMVLTTGDGSQTEAVLHAYGERAAAAIAEGDDPASLAARILWAWLNPAERRWYARAGRHAAEGEFRLSRSVAGIHEAIAATAPLISRPDEDMAQHQPGVR
ncbi:glycosyltransferase family 4 protein [Actinosynnema sp. NPDC050801]|uniref:glycosyltransferase family 4 protein n=1 Tax=unclassified Actinosynnema TaxID=2637065 RepID=UPI0034070A4C